MRRVMAVKYERNFIQLPRLPEQNRGRGCTANKGISRSRFQSGMIRGRVVGKGTGGVCVLQKQRDERSFSFSIPITNWFTQVFVCRWKKRMKSFSLEITTFVQGSWFALLGNYTSKWLTISSSRFVDSLPWVHGRVEPRGSKNVLNNSKLDNLLVNK